MERTYTDKELANIDPPPFEYEGRTYTAYEATQKQRMIERTMRKLKREKTAYNAAGLTEDAQAVNIRMRRLNEKYKEFSKAAGLPEQRERMNALYVDEASEKKATDRMKEVANSGGRGIINNKETTEYAAEFTRRRVGANGQEIIDKPTYNKLTKDFIRRGGIIIRGEDADRHLKASGAYASYIAGANIAFIMDDATISDVLEEMYHAEQDRRNLYGNILSDETLLMREIDAQKHLIAVAEKYKIPEQEQKVTQENLKYYEHLLDILQKGGRT